MRRLHIGQTSFQYIYILFFSFFKSVIYGPEDSCQSSSYFWLWLNGSPLLTWSEYLTYTHLVLLRWHKLLQSFDGIAVLSLKYDGGMIIIIHERGKKKGIRWVHSSTWLQICHENKVCSSKALQYLSHYWKEWLGSRSFWGPASQFTPQFTEKLLSWSHAGTSWLCVCVCQIFTL